METGTTHSAVVSLPGLFPFFENGEVIVNYIDLKSHEVREEETMADSEGHIYNLGLKATSSTDFLVVYTVSRRRQQRHWKHRMNVFNLRKRTWSFFAMKPVDKISSNFDSTFKIVNGRILVVVNDTGKLIDLYDLGSEDIMSTRRHIDLECDLEDGLFLHSIEQMERVNTIDNLLIAQSEEPTVYQRRKGYALISCN